MSKRPSKPIRKPAPAPATQLQIADLVPDPHNRRTHTPRNLDMIASALKAVGSGRSIVIDEHNEVIAGNGVVLAAAEGGLSKLRIVDVDGDELVAVRRAGLTDAQKRDMAIFDNRTAELAEWNTAQLAADLANGEDLAAFFLPAELEALLHPASGRHPVEFAAVDESIPIEHTCPKCGYKWSGKS